MLNFNKKIKRRRKIDLISSQETRVKKSIGSISIARHSWN